MATASSALRNSQADDMVANFDRLDIIDSSGPTVLATFTISWGSASSGQASVSGLPTTVSASATGTADEAKLYHSGGSGEEITGLTVATSGGEVTIDNTSINSGQDVELTSLSYTAPSDPIN